MSDDRRHFHKAATTAVATLLLMSTVSPSLAASSEDLDKDSLQALQTLSKTAKAMLVFPKVVKAGLVFGGSA